MIRLVDVSFELYRLHSASNDERTRMVTDISNKMEKIGLHIPDNAMHEHSYSFNVVMTVESYLDCLKEKLPVVLKAEVSLGSQAGTTHQRFLEIANRLERLLTQLPMSDNKDYNEKCEVHMPGMALATYNQTLLLENSCIDELQHHLVEGWRIIAACPQPSQRRPDFILGRFNPTGTTNRSAERG